MIDDGKEGSNCVVLFGDEFTKEFVLVDCQNNDYLYSIVVRCLEKYSINVKNNLLKWDSLGRRAYG